MSAQHLSGSSAGHSQVRWKASLGRPRCPPPALRFMPLGPSLPSPYPHLSPSLPHPLASQPASQSLKEEAGAPLQFHQSLGVWLLQSSCDSCHAQHRLPWGTLLRQSCGTQPPPPAQDGGRGQAGGETGRPRGMFRSLVT